ncbi:MAG: hypothetical protein C0173_08090, partial [Desulfurella sp.]
NMILLSQPVGTFSVAFFPALKGITGVLPQASYWLCWQDESLLFFPLLKGHCNCFLVILRKR